MSNEPTHSKEWWLGYNARANTDWEREVALDQAVKLAGPHPALLEKGSKIVAVAQQFYEFLSEGKKVGDEGKEGKEEASEEAGVV
jgi:hypothetical protein